MEKSIRYLDKAYRNKLNKSILSSDREFPIRTSEDLEMWNQVCLRDVAIPTFLFEPVRILLTPCWSYYLLFLYDLKCLESPEKKEYAEKCRAEMSGKEDKFNPFIRFFDRIDGGYNFEYYERIKIKKVIVKWCKKNDIEYVDPSSPDDFKWVIERYSPIPK